MLIWIIMLYAKVAYGSEEGTNFCWQTFLQNFVYWKFVTNTELRNSGFRFFKCVLGTFCNDFVVFCCATHTFFCWHLLMVAVRLILWILISKRSTAKRDEKGWRLRWPLYMDWTNLCKVSVRCWPNESLLVSVSCFLNNNVVIYVATYTVLWLQT